MLAGLVDVAVTTPGGTGTGDRPLHLCDSGSDGRVDQSHVSGTTLGGTSVTITGTNFTGATAVTIGGTAVTTFTVDSATQITATTAAHAAGVADVVVTTPGGTATGTGHYTYVTPAVATNTVISASTNPGLIGQPITLTGKVSPGTAAGTVTFFDGATALCSNVPLVNGVATCTVTFSAAGTHSLTAAYSGGAGFTASTSAALTLSINDQRLRTVEAIGGLLSRRNDLVSTEEPGRFRQIDRLREFASGNFNSPAGPGYSQSSTEVSSTSSIDGRHEASRVADDVTRLIARGVGSDAQSVDPFSYASQGLPGLPYGSAMVRDENSGSAGRFAFATSLSQLMRLGADAERQKLDRAQADTGFGLGATTVPAAKLAFSPLDIWVEAKYLDFREGGSRSADGHFGLVSFGADYVLSPSVLVGLMVQLDDIRRRSESDRSDVRGTGWLAGPYATVRLTDQLFWQGRAAWGRTDNDVSPYLTYTDSFETERWLISSTLTGDWRSGAWLFSPSASLSYIEDKSESYADTFGLAIPSVKSRLGQFKGGPEMAYRYQLTPDTYLEPYAGLDVIWNFADETTAAGIGSIGDDNAGPTGARGRIELGLRGRVMNGIGLDLSGTYDGIGTGDYDAFSGRAMVRVPLN